MLLRSGKKKSNQPIHASNQNAVFEINPGHFKRPFQEHRQGTDSSLALPDQYLPTFLWRMPSITSAKLTITVWCYFVALITGKAAIRNGQNHLIKNVLCRHCLVVRFGAQTKIDNFCYVAKIENPLTNCRK